MSKKIRVIVILLVIAAVCLGCVGGYLFIQEQRAGEEYDTLREMVKSDSESDDEEEVASVSSDEEEEAGTEADSTSVEIPIDFETLQAENPEIYAWITVDGTEVDYPIVQSATDNSYYLTHTVSGESKTEGAIFTENYNTTTFEDPNTVIYGHNMRNGSMFASLHDFMDKDFFDNHKDITIYTPDQILHYQIFAAYLTDDRHIMLSYDFSDDDVYEQYLYEIQSQRGVQSFVDDSVELDTDSKIITLSTCYANRDSERYLVQAVLTSTEE